MPNSEWLPKRRLVGTIFDISRGAAGPLPDNQLDLLCAETKGDQIKLRYLHVPIL